MKYLYSNGRTLEVRDIGPVLVSLTAGTTPLPIHPASIIEDAAARDLVRCLLDTRAYVREL